MLRTSLVRHIGRQLSAQQLRLISTSHATDQVLRPSSIDGASNAANESATDGFWGAKLATFGAMVAGAAAISTTSVVSAADHINTSATCGALLKLPASFSSPYSSESGAATMVVYSK
jgi:hypothetical protein